MKKIFSILFFLVISKYIYANNILLIGSGGREHALAWKLAQSDLVKHVFVAPGNGGTCKEKKVSNLDIAATDIDKLIEFAQAYPIDLILVGPEVPLAMGIVDSCKEKKILCFGPTQAAAKIESSKIFAKEFMQRHKIPTAKFKKFSDYQAAKDYINNNNGPYVIKADGLANGKGVFVVDNKEEALVALKKILIDKEFGDSGNNIIIEEFIEGQEISFIVMSDGKNILPLAGAQDHKKRFDGDTGPNTGGMGAYSPVSFLKEKLKERIIKEIIQPTIENLAKEGIPFVGFLFAGLMIKPDGSPIVLEFNCRLGDPETQAIMMRLESDLFELIFAAANGQLNLLDAKWSDSKSLTVVIVSENYPGKYQTGITIEELPYDNQDLKIFHAGTIEKNNKLITSSGRILCVSGLGNTIEEAQKKVYEYIKKIKFPYMQYRTDIASREIKSN